MKPDLDLYTDYLLCSTGQTTATGLSAMLDGLFSHDQVSDLLAHSEFDNKALWQQVKPLLPELSRVRIHETCTSGAISG